MANNPNKKALTPAQWEKQNLAKGYIEHPAYKAGKRKDIYKEYYNPSQFAPKLTKEGGYQWSNLNDPQYDFSSPNNSPVERYKAPVTDIAPEVDPSVKPLQFTPNYTLNPNTGIATLPDGQLVDPTIEYNGGGLIKKTRKYAGGGAILTGANLLGQGLNASNKPDENMQYGTNDYFDKRNKSLGTGQGVANGVGAIPIVGAFKGIGEGAANALAKKDAYGVSDKNDVAVGAAGFLNPLESTTSAFSDIGSGKFNGKTAMNLLLPGVGAVLNNNENKKQRNTLIDKANLDAQTDATNNVFNTNLANQLAYRNTYNKGGKIVGKGTGTSDSIKAKVKAGSFVVPAKNKAVAIEIKKKVLGDTGEEKAELNDQDGEDVKVSNGEVIFSPNEITEIKANGIDLDALAPDSKTKLRDHLNCGGMIKDYAKGGPITPSKKEIDTALSAKREQDLARRDKLLALRQRVLADNNPKNKFYNQSLLKDTDAKIAQLNSVYGEPKETPTKTGAQLEKALTNYSKPGLTSNSLRIQVAPKSSLSEPAQSSLNRAMANQDVDNSVVPPSIIPATTGLGSAVSRPASAIDDASNSASYDADMASRLSETAPSTNNSGKLLNGISTAINYGLPLAQTAIGLRFLKNAGDRPVDSIDPVFQKALNDANTRATYGFTPEEQALLNNQNNNLTASQRFAARNYAGGSAGNAYSMERNAINDAYGRNLSSAVQNRQLQLGKQQYADQLGLNKVELSRRLFNDKLNAWQQKQAAGANLLQTGLSNVIGANRYEQEKRSIADNNDIANNWINTI